jgi:hypothetical protein
VLAGASTGGSPVVLSENVVVVNRLELAAESKVSENST